MLLLSHQFLVFKLVDPEMYRNQVLSIRKGKYRVKSIASAN